MFVLVVSSLFCVKALPEVASTTQHAQRQQNSKTHQLRSTSAFTHQTALWSCHTAPSRTQNHHMNCQRVLLVTAHPDDEAMFFAPALHQLQQTGTSIHILCLSNGEPASATHKMLYQQSWRGVSSSSQQHQQLRVVCAPLPTAATAGHRKWSGAGASAGEGAAGCSSCAAGKQR